MGNLTPFVPKQSKTVEAIYAHWKETGDKDNRPVKSLGASMVGKACERYLWYAFRHCCEPEFDGRMYRLFERGDLEEPRMAADLRAIGCTVHVADENGTQFRVNDLGGHLAGYLDGCGLGIPEAPKTWHVLEFKTYREEKFKKLVSKGVKIVRPDHYAQMMIYMHETGMTRALYLVCNKDTDELYSERVRYDKQEAEALVERAKRIITSVEPPARIANRRDFYQCRFCDAQDVCFGGEVALPVPFISCRQCCYSTPILDSDHGRWECKLKAKTLTFGEQLKACDCHLVLSGLVLDHVVCCEQDTTTPGGPDYLVFSHERLGKWKHGNIKGAYSSEELTRLPMAMLSNDTINDVKETFSATVSGELDTILTRYPESETRLVWSGKPAGIWEAWEEAYGIPLSDCKKINTSKQPEYAVAEYEGNRIVVMSLTDNMAEIRDKCQPASTIR